MITTQRHPMVKYILATVLMLGLMMCMPARSQDFVLPEPKCLPRFNDYDYHIQVGPGPDALVWWCDMPDGLWMHYRVGEVGKGDEILGLVAMIKGRDLLALDRAIFRRWATPQEVAVVNQILASYAPRCFVDTSASSTSVLTRTSQMAIGPPAKDKAGLSIFIGTNTQVTCDERLSGTKRYCLAVGRLDTKGRMIGTLPVSRGDPPIEGWVPCRIQKAPDAGWTQ